MDAGLQEGDVIVEMNGEEVKTVEQYTRALMALNPEQSVKLLVLRQNGEEYAQLECTAVVGVLK
jgi:S1-C subfamily serine protease